MSLLFSRCMALFFLLRVSPTGFTAEVLMRPLDYVFHLFIVGIYGSIKTKIVNWLIDTKSKQEHSLYIQRA